MTNRAAKSGFAADAQAAMNKKWDDEHACTAIQWIGGRIGESLTTSGSMEDVHTLLKDGVILAKLANWVKPGAISANKVKFSAMAFKQMELIGLFLSTMDEANNGPIKKIELFQTVDLYESQNMPSVIITIEALGRAMLTCGREGFGKKESKGEHREFTDEQLKAGQGIIGLQMGSNKGASQSGQNFGKGRMIVD